MEEHENLEKWAQVDKEIKGLRDRNGVLQPRMWELAARYGVSHELYHAAYTQGDTQQVERWPELKRVCLAVHANSVRDAELSRKWIALRPALDLDSLLKTFLAPSSSAQLQQSLVMWINYKLYGLEEEIQNKLQGAIDAYKRDRRGYVAQLHAGSFDDPVWDRIRRRKLEQYVQMTHQEIKWKRLRDNLWYMEWMNDDYRLLHDKMEALTMGLHPRLGGASHVRGLSGEVVRMISDMWTARVPPAPRNRPGSQATNPQGLEYYARAERSS